MMLSYKAKISITLLKSNLPVSTLSMLSKNRGDRHASPIVNLSAVLTSFSLEKEHSAEAVVTGS